MRALKISDFASAHEYEQAKRQLRKGDRNRRQSPVVCRGVIDWNNV